MSTGASYGGPLHNQKDYIARRNRFIRAVADYYETEEASTALDEMLLAAFSLAEWLRKEGCSHLKRDKKMTKGVVPIDEAVTECVRVIDAGAEECIPYYVEAETLEVLSRNCFRRLKKIRPDLIKTWLPETDETIHHEGL